MPNFIPHASDDFSNKKIVGTVDFFKNFIGRYASFPKLVQLTSLSLDGKWKIYISKELESCSMESEPSHHSVIWKINKYEK